MKKQTLILIGALALLIAGCNQSLYFSDDSNVDENGWGLDHTLNFVVPVDDTCSIFNFIIDLRNTDSYPYSNTFLFINTTFPDGGVAYDTLECPLADLDGKWLGKTMGRYVDNRYYFRKHVIFPEKGTYVFEIGHGMRDSSITGIRNIGLTIEKATK